MRGEGPDKTLGVSNTRDFHYKEREFIDFISIVLRFPLSSETLCCGEWPGN